MKLVKGTRKIRCEMGACRRLADYTVVMDRVGIRSNIHICKDCLEELHSLIDKDLGRNEAGVKEKKWNEAH